MKSKKAQVTVFIIIGIIILIGSGLYFGLRRDTIKQELAPGIGLAIEEVPLEFRPVSSFIENCLIKTSTEGAVKLGERGGYINLIENDIVTIEDTTSSDAVQFSPGSEYSVPYWWYLSSPNDCIGECEFTVIPENKLFLKKRATKTSIESQLEDYLKNNLMVCLDNFNELKNQGFTIEEKGDLQPSVVITETDIIIHIDYPLEAERTGKREISKFFIRLPLNIKRVYDIAVALTSLEGQYHYLERDVLNLIVGFSGVNKDKLPPMSDARFQVGKIVTWKKSQVEENLKSMLGSNIQLLQVYGTRNYAPYSFPGNPLLESLYNTGMLIPGSEDYYDIDIKLNYIPFWDIYFDLNCNGEMCRPESVISDIIDTLIGIQNYNFVYDLSFPVEVEIYDPTAFNNRGYTFKFFLEGNIRDNEYLKTNFNPIEGIPVESTMLCDDRQRNSGEITINVKDYTTNQDLDDVQIAYSSYEENCLIGATENGVFKGKFPVMLGGTVNFLKDEYISYSQRFDTKLNKESELDITLKHKEGKKFIVKKKLMTKQGNLWTLGNEVELRDNEQAIVTLTKKSNLNEGDFITTSMYLGNQTIPGDIDITQGDYDINIKLLYDDAIRIPPRTIEIDDEDYTIPEFTLDEGFQTGGLNINYTFTKEDLAKGEITFYVLNPDIVAIPESQRIMEDINALSGIETTSKRYKGSLVPKFK